MLTTGYTEHATVSTGLRVLMKPYSIETLVDSYADETTVYPGHMGITTLGAERATNPFLRELATQQ